MDFIKEIPKLSEKEQKALDRKLQALEPKVFKAKEQYDALMEQYHDLWEKRYPEKQQEYVKETLYQAYMHSRRTLEEVLIYMAMPEDEEEYSDDKDEEWDL